MTASEWEVFEADALGGRQRYELLTSLVVPRPIGWIGSRSPGGDDNLAPFSYFAALSASPMLVGVSIGHRVHGPKDSLANIAAGGGFTVNVVDEAHLEAMNATSADVAPEVDEFERAGLGRAEAAAVSAPYVASAAAVFECELFRLVDLGDAPNTLVLGRVRVVRLARRLTKIEGSLYVDPSSLRPVGRLGGTRYATLGEIRTIPRPAP